MSNPNNSEILLEWFKNNLPKDNYLADEIAKRAEAAFKHIKIPIGENVNQPFFMGIGNHPGDPSRLTISMNVYGIIFLGVMAKAILDSLSSEFEGLLSGEIGSNVLDKKVKDIVMQYLSTKGLRICPFCKNENLPNAIYCGQCSNKL